MYIYTMAKSTLQRQKIIADLIEDGNISSQNQLKGVLKKRNLMITQATLSRDLNELGAIKKRKKMDYLFMCYQKIKIMMPIRRSLQKL